MGQRFQKCCPLARLQHKAVDGLLLQLLWVALPKVPSEDLLLHRRNVPGHKMLWQGELLPCGAHRYLEVGRGSKSWDGGAPYFMLWWVVLSLVSPNTRSKQPHMCAWWGFPGMLWVVWSKAQRYKRQSWHLQSSHGDSLGYTKYEGHLRPPTHHPQSLALTLQISNVQMVLTGH